MAEIEIEGLRGLRADFERAKQNAGEGGDKGLEKVAMQIVNDAKKNLTQNRTNNTGQLRASGKVQKDKEGIDAGFFSSGMNEGYAAAVEYGRGATKKPSADGISLRTSLRAWVHKKLHIPYGRALETATFFIARKIHKQGTKPQPFFVPAVKKHEGKVAEQVGKYIDEAIK